MHLDALASVVAVTLFTGFGTTRAGDIEVPRFRDIQPQDLPPLPGEAADPSDSFWLGWNGSLEAGLNGSSGNTDIFNARAAFIAERKTPFMESTASATYTRSQEGSDVTKNRFEAAARNDWLFERDSSWRYFLTGTYEYDDFQDWRHRVTVSNGIGYSFIKNDTTSLIGRAGVGVRREFGGADDDWIPEGILGAELGHRLTERQKITASVDYHPSLEDFADDYRVVTRAAWEVELDPEVKLSLKLGLEHRYDNMPGAGFDRNDLDYFALLVWKF